MEEKVEEQAKKAEESKKAVEEIKELLLKERADDLIVEKPEKSILECYIEDEQ